MKCKVKFRVVKFRINDADSDKEQWEVLITNLNRFEFPASRMKELYHMRCVCYGATDCIKHDKMCQ